MALYSFVLVSIAIFLRGSAAAPFNELTGTDSHPSDSSHLGWSCAYTGQGNAAMNPALDLPGLVNSLCSQVQYAHVGCAGFVPDVETSMKRLGNRQKNVIRTPCPAPLQWNNTLSICTLEVPYIPFLANVSPDCQPQPQGAGKPSEVKIDASEGYQDGHVFAASAGMVKSDSDGKPKSPSVVVPVVLKPTETPPPRRSSNRKKPTPTPKNAKPVSEVKDDSSQCHGSNLISSPAGSGSCEIPNTVEKPQDHVPEIVEKPQDQPPSQSEVKNSASDLDNPKPDPSSASAQSSDGPESDKPNGNNDQQPSKGHNDDPEPDSSVNAQSFDEPEVDEPEDSVQQPSEQNPTTSTYVPNASPELTAVVHNDAKNDSSSCQSPNYWNTTVSLCQSVSVSPAVPVTGPISESSHVVLSPISSQDGNITILEQATANASVPAPIEADHEVVSPTSNACQSPLKWNPILSLCMDMSVLDNTPLAGSVGSAVSVKPLPGLNFLDTDHNAGPLADLQKACQSPSRWNAELRLCMAVSALPNAEILNPSNTLASAATILGSHNDTGLDLTGHGCELGQTWSSLVSRCVTDNLLKHPGTGNTCSDGQLDSIIGMCLDVSVLGGALNILGDMSIPSIPILGGNDRGSPKSAATSCTAGQKWSELAGRCVSEGLLSNVGGDGSCKEGRLDSVLGMCLSMSVLGTSIPLNIVSNPTNTAANKSGPTGYDHIAASGDSAAPASPVSSHGCKSGQHFDLLSLNCIDLSSLGGLLGSKTTQTTQTKSTSNILSIPGIL